MQENVRKHVKKAEEKTAEEQKFYWEYAAFLWQ